jgi:hypothetical protein
VTVRGTAAMLAVLAGLVGWLWLGEIRLRGGRPESPAGTEAPPLLAAPPAAVARVELEAGTARVVALRGPDGGWTDAAGRPWRPGVVPDLVETLGSLRVVMVVDPDPAEPVDFGLGPEAQRLHLADDRGRTLLALEIGARNPAWTGLYARRSGDRAVILVGALLRWELIKLRDAAPAMGP